MRLFNSDILAEVYSSTWESFIPLLPGATVADWSWRSICLMCGQTLQVTEKSMVQKPVTSIHCKGKNTGREKSARKVGGVCFKIPELPERNALGLCEIRDVCMNSPSPRLSVLPRISAFSLKGTRCACRQILFLSLRPNRSDTAPWVLSERKVNQGCTHRFLENRLAQWQEELVAFYDSLIKDSPEYQRAAFPSVFRDLRVAHPKACLNILFSWLEVK